MSGRLEGKVAVVVGAGQTPGETIGNGRATAVVFAREGASVLCVDRRLEAAQQTVAQIEEAGGTAVAHEADATDEAACEVFISDVVERWGRIDILHNNVGIGAGDGPPHRIEMEAWDRIFDVNLKSAVLPTKKALPFMREQKSGAIINVSSVGAVCYMPTAAYKSSKAALNAYTQTLAVGNAKYGVRANVIMPGLMDTPMAVDGLARATGQDRKVVAEMRSAVVPLRAQMGDAWDVAHAALFLASEEARFITGVLLPVDGGQSARVG